jgi:hypothetical protein
VKNSYALLLTALILISFGCGSPAESDSTITTEVQNRLSADSDTQGLKLNVKTEGGVVTLSGSAATEIEKEKAEQIAKHTEGVNRVVNNITITPSPAGTPAPAEATGQEEKKTPPPKQ